MKVTDLIWNICCLICQNNIRTTIKRNPTLYGTVQKSYLISWELRDPHHTGLNGGISSVSNRWFFTIFLSDKLFWTLLTKKSHKVTTMLKILHSRHHCGINLNNGFDWYAVFQSWQRHNNTFEFIYTICKPMIFNFTYNRYYMIILY